jgi:micrococcal nuclease
VTVRLAEIDAPEKRQPFGDRSKVNLSMLCFGAWATIRPETRDKYGRTVARVECRGRDANAEQVRAGMAWAYTAHQRDQSFPQLQETARVQRLGLWGDRDPVAPWDWRKAQRGSRSYSHQALPLPTMIAHQELP